jgi:hypothetical protein
MRILALLLLLLPALPASAQAAPTPQDLAVEIRALRTESQSLRHDLKRAQAEADKARELRAATEQNLQGMISGQEARVRALQSQTERLTWLAVGLGALALLALAAALRRRPETEVSPELLLRQSRIAQLRDLVAADDARLAELGRPADKEPRPSV